MKSLLVVFSYHHKNTEKVAQVIAKVLDAQIKTPQQINPEELLEYSLIGFGSGIYAAKHHTSLLDLVDTLPDANGRKAFLFSTFGARSLCMMENGSGNLLHKTTCCSGKNYNPKGTRLLMNLVVLVLTRIVFSNSLED